MAYVVIPDQKHMLVPEPAHPESPCCDCDDTDVRGRMQVKIVMGCCQRLVGSTHMGGGQGSVSEGMTGNGRSQEIFHSVDFPLFSTLFFTAEIENQEAGPPPPSPTPGCVLTPALSTDECYFIEPWRDLPLLPQEERDGRVVQESLGRGCENLRASVSLAHVVTVRRTAAPINSSEETTELWLSGESERAEKPLPGRLSDFSSPSLSALRESSFFTSFTDNMSSMKNDVSCLLEAAIGVAESPVKAPSPAAVSSARLRLSSALALCSKA
ncbi:hypothetical protein DNTS_011093 [Danionella cerebrum]|uniref:Uncharacterized protein n=1 Tax=Danionella cerebrum TaxID=2873325 RepID=A0A553RNZ2_9TELE|nr:hypothetical protein DNTS_011093 [Danionella translucida]